MVKIRKYDITTINFGQAGHPARILKGLFVEKNGKQELSALMRKLIVVHLSTDERYEDWKKLHKIHELKQTRVDKIKLAKKLQNLYEELHDLGVDPENV